MYNKYSLKRKGDTHGNKITYTSLGQRSVYCFVAKFDNKTNALGIVKQGDMLKSASWNTPARTSRGSIYKSELWDTRCEQWGMIYLR